VGLTCTRQSVPGNVLSLVGVRDADVPAVGHELRGDEVVGQRGAAGVAACGRVPEAEVGGGGCLALLHWAAGDGERGGGEEGEDGGGELHGG